MTRSEHSFGWRGPVAAIGALVIAATQLGCSASPDTELDRESIGTTRQAITHGTTYTIKVPLITNGGCVDVNGNSSADGANVQEWSCNGSSAQNFVATDHGGGWFSLKHQGTNGCLNRNTTSNNSSGGGNVHQWDCQWAAGSAEYQWSFQSSNGYQRIVNKYDGKCLDVNGGSSANGTNIQTWSCNGSSAQTFNPVVVGGGGGGGVTLYQHCNYTGWSASFGTGSFTMSNLISAGGVNDDASSIRIPSGYTVTLYQNDNFGGTSKVLTGDNSCFTGINFNDETSSLVVSTGTSCTPTTCSAAGASCGSISNGCGGTLNCGSCSSGYTCSSNQCVASGGSTKRVVGYVPSWNSSTPVPYSKLTHINIAFAVPTSSGGLTGPDNQTWLKNTVVPTAHSNGIKVCVSVGGWMADSPGAGTFDSAISSTYRTALVNNIVNLVNYLGADCADIDYEYVGSDAASNYDAFITQLDNALGSGKLLTAAVAAFGGNADTFPSSTFDNFDFINLMAYDIQHCQHSSYQHAVDSINYWRGRGLPASKVVLGLPLYSHTCSGFGPTYGQLVSQNSANACRDSDGTNYYNGIQMIRDKSVLARSYGGVMFWESSQDHNSSASLVTAMYEALNSQAGSYNCSGGGGGGGGGGSCAVYEHSSAGPCGWWTYSDCCDPCVYGSTSSC